MICDESHMRHPGITTLCLCSNAFNATATMLSGDAFVSIHAAPYQQR